MFSNLGLDLEFYSNKRTTVVKKRQEAQAKVAVVRTAPTRGMWRLSPELAEVLGVAVGSYVTIAKGNGKHYICNMTGIVDGEGNNEGSLLAATGKNSPVLGFSHAASWEDLGGAPEVSNRFVFGETTELNNGNKAIQLVPLDVVNIVKRKSNVAIGANTAVAENVGENASVTDTSDSLSL